MDKLIKLKPVETIGASVVLLIVIGLCVSLVSILALFITIGWKTVMFLVPIWILMSWLLYKKATKKIEVVEFHNMLAMFLKRPVKEAVFDSGLHWIIFPIIFSASTQPVPKTRFVHTDTEHKKEIIDFGHFTPYEAEGQVFMGERLFKAIVSVQSRDSVEVLVDANYVVRVENPILWKSADNPWGTLMNRFEASLRIAVSKFNSTDINDLQSAIPHILSGGTVFLARCAKKNGNLDEGDVIRHEHTREPIFRKFKKFDKTDLVRKPTETERKKIVDDLLAELNQFGDKDGKPDGGFKETHLVVMSLNAQTEAVYLEEKRLGAKDVTMAIQDITLPESIASAAAKAKATMKDRVTAITAAETAKLASEEMPDMNTEEGRVRAEMVLAERGKATYVIGRGDNIIAQLGAILKG